MSEDPAPYGTNPRNYPTIQIQGTDADRVRIGISLFRSFQWRLAREVLSEVTTKDSEAYVRARKFLIDMKNLTLRFEEVLPEAEDLYRRFPDKELSRLSIILTLTYLERYQEALDILDQGATFEALRPGDRYQRACLLAPLGRYEEAIGVNHLALN